jgi:hypothetical protein
MKIIKIKVYTLNELSDKAKKHAYNKWLSDFQYHWNKENEDSIKAFAAVFPVTIKNWSYGGNDSRVEFYMTGHNHFNSDQVEDLEGWKLARYIWNKFRFDIYKPKQYWICNGRHNTVGENAKHRESKILITGENCPLTGFIMDQYLLDPIVKFLNHPDERTTFRSLMKDCFSEWVMGCERDLEYAQSFERFKEEAEANEWLFRENGEMEG